MTCGHCVHTENAMLPSPKSLTLEAYFYGEIDEEELTKGFFLGFSTLRINENVINS